MPGLAPGGEPAGGDSCRIVQVGPGRFYVVIRSCCPPRRGIMPGLSGPPDTPPRPPIAKKQARTTALHGVTLVDDYHWLRDKTDPDVTAYLEAENAYTEAGTQHLAALRERLYREMLGRIKETDTNVPVRDGGYWYYIRTEEGQAYAIFCRRRESLDVADRVEPDLVVEDLRTLVDQELAKQLH